MSDGPHCQIWTPEDVRRWLVAAMIALPTTPIYSKPGGRVGAVSMNVPDATFDWIGFLNEVIEAREVRLTILTWAKVEAKREVKRRKLRIEIPCASIPDFCLEHRISRQAFEKRVKVGLARLARERSIRSSPADDMEMAA